MNQARVFNQGLIKISFQSFRANSFELVLRFPLIGRRKRSPLIGRLNLHPMVSKPRSSLGKIKPEDRWVIGKPGDCWAKKKQDEVLVCKEIDSCMETEFMWEVSVCCEGCWENW